ncbi:MAG: FKBP-type peptidyl-prolyl cis-trans isomerase [Nitrospiraceae bacterium]
MRQVRVLALAFALVLTVGITAHAAMVAPDESAPQEEAGDQPSVTEGAKVTIAFTIAIPEVNEVITGNVSEYVAGEDEVIPALEKELMGLKPGEHKHVDLAPEEAFGPHDETKMMRISRKMLPPTAQSGVIYETPHGDPFTVVALSDDTAVVDFNHPLAGKHLVLDVEVLSVEHHREEVQL